MPVNETPFYVPTMADALQHYKDQLSAMDDDATLYTSPITVVWLDKTDDSLVFAYADDLTQEFTPTEHEWNHLVGQWKGSECHGAFDLTAALPATTRAKLNQKTKEANAARYSPR